MLESILGGFSFFFVPKLGIVMFCAAALSKLILFYWKAIKVLFLGLGFSALMQDLNANPIGGNCCDFKQSSTFVLFKRLIPGKKAGSDSSATPTVTRSSGQFTCLRLHNNVPYLLFSSWERWGTWRAEQSSSAAPWTITINLVTLTRTYFQYNSIFNENQSHLQI